MKHRKKGHVFGRQTKQRKSFLRGLSTSLISHGKITTTEIRAKSIKPLIDKMITRAKSGTMASKRILISEVGPKSAKKLSEEIAPKFSERHGGYTRIIKMPVRLSDGAKMARIEILK